MGIGPLYTPVRIQTFANMNALSGLTLKLVRPGMDSRRVLARFDAERQALARMDHPFVSKVLDAGSTEDGRPFFVMEYVPGARITEHCDRAASTPAPASDHATPLAAPT